MVNQVAHEAEVFLMLIRQQAADLPFLRMESVSNVEDILSLLAAKPELQPLHSQRVQPDEFVGGTQHAVADNLQGDIRREGIGLWIPLTVTPVASHEQIWNLHRRHYEAPQVI